MRILVFYWPPAHSNKYITLLLISIVWLVIPIFEALKPLIKRYLYIYVRIYIYIKYVQYINPQKSTSVMFFASWNPVRLPSHQQIPAACRRLRLEAPACRAPDNPVRWDPSDASASWGLQQTLWWKWRYNGNIEGYIWIITDYNGIIGIAPLRLVLP